MAANPGDVLSRIDTETLRKLTRKEMDGLLSKANDGLDVKVDIDGADAKKLADLLVESRGSDLLVGPGVGLEVRTALLQYAVRQEWLHEACRERNIESKGRHTRTLARDLGKRPFRAGGKFAQALVKELNLPPQYVGQSRATLACDEVVHAVDRLPAPWDHQEVAVKRILEHWQQELATNNHQPALLCLPTGAGKSRCAADAIADWVVENARRQDGPMPLRVIWVAHSKELLGQAHIALAKSWVDVTARRADIRRDEPAIGFMQIRRLDAFGPLDAGLGEPADGAACEVLLVSAMKLFNVLPRRTTYADRFRTAEAMGHPDLVIIDETHRAEAKTYRPLVPTSRNNDGLPWRVLGLTATPYRGKGLGPDSVRLRRRFRNLLVDPFLGKNAYELLEQRGILARVRVRRVNTKVLTEASQVDAIDDFGDAFTHHQLDQLGRNKERNSILVSKILQFAKEHTVLVFACNVTHARRIAAALRVQRVSAAAVVEDTSAGVRAERLRQLQKGELRVLVSVDLITAGFDAPGVGAIVMGRPTTSLVRYMQMVGRGLRGRAAGGTDTCYVIDLRDRQGPKKQKAIHYGVIKQLWKQSSQSEKPGVASTDVG